MARTDRPTPALGAIPYRAEAPPSLCFVLFRGSIAHVSAAQSVPFFLIGLADVIIVSAVGILWFQVPFVGNPFIMLLGASLFLLAALGLGLLMSTFSRTQQQAFALNFFFLNPIFILSGFAFPISAMPRVLQWLTYLNPLRYFLVVIRAVFLKGVGILDLWQQLGAMAVLGTAMLALSVLRFRKSLD